MYIMSIKRKINEWYEHHTQQLPNFNQYIIPHSISTSFLTSFSVCQYVRYIPLRQLKVAIFKLPSPFADSAESAIFQENRPFFRGIGHFLGELAISVLIFTYIKDQRNWQLDSRIGHRSIIIKKDIKNDKIATFSRLSGIKF